MNIPPGYQFPLFFVVWWCFVLYLISIMGGWRRLAGIYPYEGRFRGRAWRFQTIAMRWWTGYGSCVHVGADTRGLYLSVPFLFRPGHPPLMLPWDDISARRVRLLGRTRFELRSRRAEDIPIRITPSLGEKIAAASGGRLDLEQSVAGQDPGGFRGAPP